MPFVRVHGKQLAIVHGVRRAGNVEQDALFTLYSQAEVDAAIGAEAPRFQAMLEERHPRIRFDWPRLAAQMTALREKLPAAYAGPEARQGRDFREALVAFTRAVMLANPQDDPNSTAVLRENTMELDVLEHWLRMRREAAKVHRPPSSTPPSPWRFGQSTETVPFTVEDVIGDQLDATADPKLVPTLMLLLEAFPRFADGHNALGLIALREGRVDDAIAHFTDTTAVARAALPKRIPKSVWTENDAAPPYVRGLGNLALALNRAGRHTEALDVANLLAGCNAPVVAAARTTVSLLHLGRYAEARDAALACGDIYLTGFAEMADRRPKDGRNTLVAALLSEPRIAQHIAGLRVPPATSPDEAREDEHAAQLQADLGSWLRGAGGLVPSTLRDLLRNARIASIVSLRHTLETESRLDKSRVEKIHEMKSPEFAAKVQRDLSRAMADTLL